MNSLGLQYSTSDDETEEENEPHAAAQPEFLSPATITPPTSTSSLVIDNLPPSPRGDADPQIQARIARFLDVQNNKSVKSFQVNLQTKKEVANPYILNNVVDYFGIDQLETNFAPHVFDPYNLPLHEYTDKIAMEQEKFTQARLERRQQSQSTRDCIAFTNARQSNAF